MKSICSGKLPWPRQCLKTGSFSPLPLTPSPGQLTSPPPQSFQIPLDSLQSFSFLLCSFPTLASTSIMDQRLTFEDKTGLFPQLRLLYSVLPETSSVPILPEDTRGRQLARVSSDPLRVEQVNALNQEIDGAIEHRKRGPFPEVSVTQSPPMSAP
ncbi:hypothetical protein MJT46_011266 [Ovis ammon polii x Ovis aries]|nr:hypothetical protein MJT46_011266 [Ovis ammon polii x Ovis aries]